MFFTKCESNSADNADKKIDTEVSNWLSAAKKLLSITARANPVK